MGICPCTRDAEFRLSLAKEDPQEFLPTENPGTPSHRLSSFAVNLRAEDCIIRLVAPFKSTYKLVSDLRVEGPTKVSLAKFISTKKMCIVKSIPKGRLTAKGTLNRLMHIDHPNVVKTYEVCQDDANIYVVTEACSGGLLSDFLATHNTVNECEAASVTRQVLSALVYCHQLGTPHCSLSPQSISLKEPLTNKCVFIKVSGFENFDLMASRHHDAVIGFLAPELVEKQIANSKCDIWSVGAILYLMLSGDYPLAGQTPGSKYRGFSFPPERWRHISRDAMSLISSMMSRKPGQRPSALQCLAHPWLQKPAFMRPLTSKAVTNCVASLRFVYLKQTLKRAIFQFMLDRVLEDKNMTPIARVFSSLDRDGDGVLSEEEMLAALQVTLPGSEAQLELDSIFEDAGDRRSCVSWTEFLLAAYRDETLLARENLRATFKALDKDRSGKISAQEMRMFFRINGSSGSVDQWKALMSLVDKSGDGEIDFQEFETLMCSR